MTAGEGTPKRARFTFDRAMSALSDVTNASPRRRRSAKCLFGAPDREETERLVSEQYSRDRKRYIRRYNFDIDTERAYEGDITSLSPGTPRRRTPKAPRTPARSPRTPKTPRAAARSPRVRRQLYMTDYWTIRKASETSPNKEN